MPIYHALHSSLKNDPLAMDMKNKIVNYLSVHTDSVNVFFGYEYDKNHLYIKLQDFNIGHNFFDFQKLIDLQKILNIKINKFRIFGDRVVNFWCEFIKE